MDDERTSVQKLVGWKITKIEQAGYGIHIFSRKNGGKEHLIAMSKMNEPCFFDGNGNLFAEIA